MDTNRTKPTRRTQIKRKQPNRDGLCECGCGERPNPGNRFVYPHRVSKSLVDYLELDCGHVTPCWVWQKAASTTKGGRYGTLTEDGKTKLAHRVYYLREHGVIPLNFDLDHLCRNTLCVNPHHLEPVSHLVNVRRGAAVKIPLETVKEIIRHATELNWAQRETARYFGINPSTVCRLVNGKRRKDDA